MAESASRVTEDPTTFVRATAGQFRDFAARTAQRVSAVSPDWVTARTGFRDGGTAYLNSDACSTRTGIPAHSSRRYFAMSPAWYEVPQATMVRAGVSRRRSTSGVGSAVRAVS